jgi:hypothetical protein
MEARKQADREAMQKVDNILIAPTTGALAPPMTVNIPVNIQREFDNTVADTHIVNTDDPIHTVAFKVTASISKLKTLKQFLTDGGYDYE